MNRKKRACEARIRKVEHSSFTQLVFAATRGMGYKAVTFYKRLASFLSDKWKKHYAAVLGWIKCCYLFAYFIVPFNVF